MVSDITEKSIPNDAKLVLLAVYHTPKVRDVSLENFSIYIGEDVNKNKTVKSKGSKEVKAIAKIFVRCIWEAGIKYELGELIILTTAVVKEIFRRFSHMSIGEVQLAIENGVRKDYGGYYGINVVTVNQWLKAFQSTNRVDAMKYLPLVTGSDKPREFTDEEKKELHLKWFADVEKHYNIFCQTGKFEYYDLKNMFYDLCEKHSLGQLTNPEKQKVYAIALRKFKTEHHPAKAKGRTQRLDFARMLEKLEKGDASQEIKVKIKAKQIAVKTIFEKLQKGNFDFKTILTLK